jgi:hypothetical protein
MTASDSSFLKSCLHESPAGPAAAGSTGDVWAGSHGTSPGVKPSGFGTSMIKGALVGLYRAVHVEALTKVVVPSDVAPYPSEE